MFTVMVGFEGSGKSSTLRPLARRYSVMPSTVVTRVTPVGADCPMAGGGTPRAIARARQVSRDLRFMVSKGGGGECAPGSEVYGVGSLKRGMTCGVIQKTISLRRNSPLCRRAGVPPPRVIDHRRFPRAFRTFM